jgi:hypothetical protein
MTSSTSANMVLLQYGTDPLNFEFEDSEQQIAFQTYVSSIKF